MLNRRYALLGWAVWRVGKVMAKKRARGMVGSSSSGSRLNPKLLLPVAAVALGGAYLFLRRGGGDDGGLE